MNDFLYLIERDDLNAPRSRSTLIVQQHPGRTNVSGEKRENGWLGTTNNVWYYAHGRFASLAEVRAYIEARFDRVTMMDDTYEGEIECYYVHRIHNGALFRWDEDADADDFWTQFDTVDADCLLICDHEGAVEHADERLQVEALADFSARRLEERALRIGYREAQAVVCDQGILLFARNPGVTILDASPGPSEERPCDCHRALIPVTGCTFKRVALERDDDERDDDERDDDENRVFERVRYGSEPTAPMTVHAMKRCADCGTRIGNTHHVGCLFERCPRCAQRLNRDECVCVVAEYLT